MHTSPLERGVPPTSRDILTPHMQIMVISAPPVDTYYSVQENWLETARLVARGDLQRAGEDYGETFAPVIKLVSLRMLLTLAAMFDTDLYHWDVVAAFLHGALEEEVYMSLT